MRKRGDGAGLQGNAGGGAQYNTRVFFYGLQGQITPRLASKKKKSFEVKRRVYSTALYCCCWNSGGRTSIEELCCCCAWDLLAFLLKVLHITKVTSLRFDFQRTLNWKECQRLHERS
jgi:hypothetical protein